MTSLKKLIAEAFQLLVLVGLTVTHANAATTETFDTQAAMDNLLVPDVGTTLTWYETQPFGIHTGVVVLNPTGTNSVSLIEDNYEITSFNVSEVLTTSSFDFTFDFYDSSDTLIDTLTYDTRGNGFSGLVEIDLLAAGISGANKFDFTHSSGSLAIDSLTYQTSPVPLPGAVWLFLSGIGGLFGINKWNKCKVATKIN